MGSDQPKKFGQVGPVRLVPLAFVLVLIGLIFFRGRKAEPPPRPHELTGEAFGTSWRVLLGAHTVRTGVPAAEGIAVLERSIARRLAAIDERMSTWRDDSELSKFNALQETEPQPLTPETRGQVALALRLARLSGGAFDPTVMPLVRLWGFARAKHDRAPTEAELAAARADVGYDKLTLDEANGTLAKARPGVSVDLSACAKGYAVDEVARLLDAARVPDYWVEIGGEVRVRGRNALGRPWRVGIESSTAPGTARRVLTLSSGSVATSGDYRNFKEVDGARRSHIIDPRTGAPVTHRLTSCSVYHERCADADGWATALMVLGPEAGPALAREQGLAVLFQTRQPDGSTAVSTTPAWEVLTKMDDRKRTGGR